MIMNTEKNSREQGAGSRQQGVWVLYPTFQKLCYTVLRENPRKSAAKKMGE